MRGKPRCHEKDAVGSVLVDTSVWIDFFNGVKNPHSDLLALSIECDEPVFLHSLIVMEILQGFRSDRQHSAVRGILLSFDFVREDPIEDALGASDLYRSMRKKGATIRKSLDCLIAYAAIKNGLPLLHRDRDFDKLAKHTKLTVIMP